MIMIVCVEGLKRVCKESIIVKELQGVKFSLNDGVGGEAHVFRLSLIHILPK